MLLPEPQKQLSCLPAGKQRNDSTRVSISLSKLLGCEDYQKFVKASAWGKCQLHVASAMQAVESRGDTGPEISGSVPMIGIQPLTREGRKPDSLQNVKPLDTAPRCSGVGTGRLVDEKLRFLQDRRRPRKKVEYTRCEWGNSNF